MDTQTPVRLTLFGDFNAEASGGENVKGLSLAAKWVLAYLGYKRGSPVPRTQLAAMIWEEKDEAHARQNLRQSLHQIHKAMPQDWDGLVTDRTSVMLDTERTQTDGDALWSELKSGRIPSDLLSTPVIHEQFLAQLRTASELAQSWRRVTQRQIEDDLRNQLTTLLDGNDPQTGERAARALMMLDPSDETAARWLISHYWSSGQTGRALDTYSRLWVQLEDTYEMEPSAQTQALIVDIKTAETPAAERASPKTVAGLAEPSAKPLWPHTASPDRGEAGNRLGVLPVSDPISSPEYSNAAALFRAEFLSQLARFRDIAVVDLARTEIDADYELSFVFVLADENIALIAMLTRRSDQEILWSDRFEELTKHWWSVQSRLAGRIASVCGRSFSRARVSEIGKLSTVSKAIDHWLLGEQALVQFRSEASARAESHFRDALTADPEFSRAYSSLAQLYNGHHLTNVGAHRQRRRHQDAKALANKAIALDPLDCRAHLHRAWASTLLHEWGQAASEFEQALTCNPQDPWTLMSCALGAAFGGRCDLAVDLAARSLTEGMMTTPAHWGYQSTICFLVGDLERCVEAAENAGIGIPNIPAWKAAALWHLGRADEARAAWEEFETTSRQLWSAPHRPDKPAILSWFLSCFPLASGPVQSRLAQGVSRAAGIG